MPRISRFLLAAPVGVAMAAMAACGGPPERGTADLPTDLRKDLELAKASSMELASSSRARTQVVSGLEAGQAGTRLQGDRAPAATPAPRARPELTPVVRRAAQRTVEAPVAEVAEEIPAPAADEAEAPAPTMAAAPAPEPEAAPAEPVSVAGPATTSDGAGDSRPRDPGGWGDAGNGDVGRGGGGGWGGLGGVIIRGGGIGDDDHCQIRPRRRPVGGGYPIGSGRYPTGGTVYIPRAGGTGGSGQVGGGGEVTRTRGGGGFGGGAVSAPNPGRSRGGR